MSDLTSIGLEKSDISTNFTLNPNSINLNISISSEVSRGVFVFYCPNLNNFVLGYAYPQIPLK